MNCSSDMTCLETNRSQPNGTQFTHTAPTCPLHPAVTQVVIGPSLLQSLLAQSPYWVDTLKNSGFLHKH